MAGENTLAITETPHLISEIISVVCYGDAAIVDSAETPTTTATTKVTFPLFWAETGRQYIVDSAVAIGSATQSTTITIKTQAAGTSVAGGTTVASGSNLSATAVTALTVVTTANLIAAGSRVSVVFGDALTDPVTIQLRVRSRIR